MTNRDAFLDATAFSEGTPLIPDSDNGYRALVGGGTFQSYADHPRLVVFLPRLNIRSTAAGRYQLLERYFDFYAPKLDLTDFSPASQDAIALQQIKECGALPFIDAGNLTAAVNACHNIWASLPGSQDGQHTQTMAYIQRMYLNAGGTLAKPVDNTSEAC